MRAHLLVFVKKALNRWAKGAVRAVPGVYARKPVSKLVKRLMDLLQKGLKLHPKRFYADKNFPRLLRAVERTLIFICEEDPHYAGWLAEAMLLTAQLVQETRREFPPGAEGDRAWIAYMAQVKIAKTKQVD